LLADERVSACLVYVCQRVQRRGWRDAAVIHNALELAGRPVPISSVQPNEASHVRGPEPFGESEVSRNRRRQLLGGGPVAGVDLSQQANERYQPARQLALVR
jgi:hypothetical protein